MRFIFMSVVIASCASGGALADDNPTIVAVWEHRVIGRDATPSKMTLYSNHGINDPDGKNVWSRSGNTLTLTWPNPKAPGGKWVDRCAVSVDGKTYSGRNQAGAKLVGKLVDGTAEVNPKVQPPAANPPSGYVTGRTVADRNRFRDVLALAKKEEGGEARFNIEFLEQSANAGNAQSMYELGIRYYFGKNVDKDEKKGVAWVEKAAKAGHPGGMYSLATCYFNGIHVKKDFKLANEWLKKAAHAGSPEAQKALASASGTSGWQSMSGEQKAKALGGLLILGLAAAALSPDQPATGASTPACGVRNLFNEKCTCRGFEPRGGPNQEADPFTCKECGHSLRDHRP